MSRNSGAELIGAILGLIIEIALEADWGGNKKYKRNDYDYTPTRDEYLGLKYNDKPKPSFEDPRYSTPIKKEEPKKVQKLDTEKYEKKVEEYRTSSIVGIRSTKQIKLEILLLSYMFMEDDGKINLREKNAIKKHYAKVKRKLSPEDIEYIKEISNMDPSLLNIRAFISQNDVSEKEITNAIRTMKECNKDPKRYDKIVDRVQSSLLESVGY